MVLPFILTLFGLSAAAGVAGEVFGWWGQMKGKTLAVLGARGVGKTHLQKFLTAGSLCETHKQTVAPERTPGNTIQLRELELKVNKGLDVSGDKSARAEWENLVAEADYVLYLLRADKIIGGDRHSANRAKADMRHIRDWLDSRSPATLFIIGTHCDLDPLYSEVTDCTRGDYMDRFRQLQVIEELVNMGGGPKRVKVVIGEMKTRNGIEELAYSIFSQALGED